MKYIYTGRITKILSLTKKIQMSKMKLNINIIKLNPCNAKKKRLFLEVKKAIENSGVSLWRIIWGIFNDFISLK